MTTAGVVSHLVLQLEDVEMVVEPVDGGGAPLELTRSAAVLSQVQRARVLVVSVGGRKLEAVSA